MGTGGAGNKPPPDYRQQASSPAFSTTNTALECLLNDPYSIVDAESVSVSKFQIESALPSVKLILQGTERGDKCPHQSIHALSVESHFNLQESSKAGKLRFKSKSATDSLTAINMSFFNCLSFCSSPVRLH